jgi:hypothetical protein
LAARLASSRLSASRAIVMRRRVRKTGYEFKKTRVEFKVRQLRRSWFDRVNTAELASPATE